MPAEVCTHPWMYAVEPFRIAGGLYYVGNRDVSCHLIDTGDGLILLDTAFPQTVYLLLESIRRLGFDPNEVAYILHSHAHYDHCGGTPAFVGLTGAATALGAADVPIVQEHAALTWAPEYGFEFHEAFDVDIPLQDGDVIALGNTKVCCMHTPGHTPGTMSYFFEITEEGATLTVGIHGGPGINTLTDQYMEEHGLPATRRTDYLSSLARLRERPVDIFIGAHPGPSRTLERQAQRTSDHNPFVDPEAWQAFLGDLQRTAEQAWGSP